MATHIPLAPVREGQDWLLSCAPDPIAAQGSWDAQQLAAIPSGAHWRVAEARLSRSLDALRRMGSIPRGPVLADTRRGKAWWLIPPGLDDELDDIAGLLVHPVGWILGCPPVALSADGRWWLEHPDGSGTLTDPILLAAAFGPGSYRPDAEVPA